ncbi:GNAT family N-acetyltransferase [Phaeobacter sp. B1627]|uniref:GNAT family N-acetyltransferase n=1 Tax=Phaeobacter sp. B1627 TaxID=2583809 RepID=UPI00111A6FFD|nr:GNAT family N-acetyltransferase [Phaeobacter sp. B1627]TNJ41442.1 GNAT family N-acetyltransferase [Phaeobacter sp. B1627]
MSVSLSLILPRERGRLSSLLAPYFADVSPNADIDPLQRAEQMLNRKDVTAFWIHAGDLRTGFAIVLNLPDDRRELSEFMILPNYRRRGLGTAAAALILNEFPGFWRMGISRHSRMAAAFWGTCLSLLPNVSGLREGAPFTDQQIKSFTFEIEGPHHG